MPSPISRLTPSYKTVLTVVALLFATAPASFADASNDPFHRNVRSYFQKYCIDCHSTAEAKGGMDLEVIQRPEDFLEYPTALTHAIDVLEAEEMPPKKAKLQPTASETERAIAWLNAELNRQRNTSPNDPGIVVAPRLNSNEFGNAIRHLFETTQFDASTFLTAEGGAGEGFANVGEAQNMGTSQFESYLTAATRVLSHARITPLSGISWANRPQGDNTSNADLLKRLTQAHLDWMSLRIVDLGKSHPAELKKAIGMTWGAYAERAWKFQNRAVLGLSSWATLEQAATAAEPRLYPEILSIYHAIFTGKDSDLGKSPLVTAIITRANSLKPSPSLQPATIRKHFQDLESWATAYVDNARFARDFGLLDRDLISPQKEKSAVLMQDWEGGAVTLPVNLSRSTTGEAIITLADCGDGNQDDFFILHEGVFTFADGSTKPWEKVFPSGLADLTGKLHPWAKDSSPKPTPLKPDGLALQAPVQLRLTIPAGAKTLFFKTLPHPSHKDSSVQITVDERPPEFVDGGRIVSRRVLAAAQSKRAKEFDKNFAEPGAYFRDFGRFVRANERNAYANLPWLDASTAKALAIPFPQTGLTGKAGFQISPATLIATASPDDRAQIEAIDAQLRELAGTADPATERAAADKLIAAKAERAWRRAPTKDELVGLRELYEKDRADGFPYDFAVKTALKAILVSPDFLYRFQEVKNSTEPYPISDLDLADRLAFFLWASPPDDELLALARAGKLQDPATLKLQTKRMLADPRASALATEFVGQWLHFAGFDAFTGPDSAKFPEFTPALRKAMYDETRLFTLDLLQNNRSLNNLILADYTFANETLAKFYGLPGAVKGPEMRRVSTTGTPRGGLLAMGSFLTHRSNPLRTSPVKRGVWVYEQILGVKLPPPPPVPTLSDSETNEAGLTIAKQLEAHRSKPECASCHAKFDALGFSLENFDPIGRWRTKDGAGNPLETNEKLGTGQTIAGLDGLRAYLDTRLDEVILTYCRKLTGYALGRSILVTDKPLLDQMVAAVKAAGNTPQAAISVLLESRQFRYRRDEAPPAASPSVAAVN